MIPRDVGVLNNVLSVRLVGASGLVMIIAPLPSLDKSVLPIMFVATILAKIEDPHGILNGD